MEIIMHFEKKSRRFEEEIIDLQVFRGDLRTFEEENKNLGDSKSFEELWEPCISTIICKCIKRMDDVIWWNKCQSWQHADSQCEFFIHHISHLETKILHVFPDT